MRQDDPARVGVGRRVDHDVGRDARGHDVASSRVHRRGLRPADHRGAGDDPVQLPGQPLDLLGEQVVEADRPRQDSALLLLDRPLLDPQTLHGAGAVVAVDPVPEPEVEPGTRGARIGERQAVRLLELGLSRAGQFRLAVRGERSRVADPTLVLVPLAPTVDRHSRRVGHLDVGVVGPGDEQGGPQVSRRDLPWAVDDADPGAEDQRGSLRRPVDHEGARVEGDQVTPGHPHLHGPHVDQRLNHLEVVDPGVEGHGDVLSPRDPVAVHRRAERRVADVGDRTASLGPLDQCGEDEPRGGCGEVVLGRVGGRPGPRVDDRLLQQHQCGAPGDGHPLVLGGVVVGEFVDDEPQVADLHVVEVDTELLVLGDPPRIDPVAQVLERHRARRRRRPGSG